MGALLEKVKDLFTEYDDEDYQSDYIIDDDEYMDYLDNYYNEDDNSYEEDNYEDNHDDEYQFKTFTESATDLSKNYKKTNNKGANNMNYMDGEPRSINFNDMNAQKVVIVHPESLEAGQEIANNLKAGRICIVNFEQTDERLAQRIIDFLTGSAYSLGGKITAVSQLIFVVAPLNVSVSEASAQSKKRDYSELKKIVNGL